LQEAIDGGLIIDRFTVAVHPVLSRPARGQTATPATPGGVGGGISKLHVALWINCLKQLTKASFHY